MQIPWDANRKEGKTEDAEKQHGIEQWIQKGMDRNTSFIKYKITSFAFMHAV